LKFLHNAVRGLHHAFAEMQGVMFPHALCAQFLAHDAPQLVVVTVLVFRLHVCWVQQGLHGTMLPWPALNLQQHWRYNWQALSHD
jgi:hypothetical protein